MADTAADKLRLLAEEQRRAADLARKAKRLLGGGGRTYEEHKASAADRSAAMSAAGRDIGELPKPVNWSRRRKAAKSLRKFTETYGKRVFHLAWSDDHIRVLSRLEEAVTSGGQFALAMPRGSGKTSMVAWATLWALVTGRRRMVVIVGADARASTGMLEILVGELEGNETLAADWPEACVPIRRLEGIHQRASGQLCCGKRTTIGITADELVLPSVPREAVERPEQLKGCGGVVRCVGITGRIRGMQARLADGSIVRPSLVLIDDPQTDESAKSPSQCDYRERIIAGAVLGMAGPGEKMAALATVTVIRPDDLADRLLTPERHPDWRSERTRLVYEWGTGEALWREYAEIRRDPERGPAAATAFYAERRAAMDDGVRVAWPARFVDGELSAIQHAWNLRIDRGEAAFLAEFQNDPLPESRTGATSIDPDEVLERVANVPRGTVPSEATVLTAGIDVQGSCLYWLLAAWTDNGSGWVVDYGMTPDQPHGRLALGELSVSLDALVPGGSAEARISAGCIATFEKLCGRDWPVEGGSIMRVDRALIDSGWGQFTETVRSAVKGCRYPVMPSKGASILAKSTRGLNETKRSPGDRVGLHWRSNHPMRFGSNIRDVRIDVNYWKSWIAARLRTSPSEPGALLLCGSSPADIRRHTQFAEQLAAEECVSVEARGKRADEWGLRRPGVDNHLLDCLVMAAVAGNMQGVTLGEVAPSQSVRVVKRLSLSEIQARRRA